MSFETEGLNKRSNGQKTNKDRKKERKDGRRKRKKESRGSKKATLFARHNGRSAPRALLIGMPSA